MDDKVDKKLFARFTSGDDDALRRIIGRYRNPLYNYLMRVLRDRAVADDAFQETFLRAYSNSHNFDTSKPFKTWLFAIATNVARDEIKRRRRENAVSLEQYARQADGEPLSLKNALAAAVETPLDEAVRREDAEGVERCLDALPDLHREILVLFHYEKMRYREIAEALGIPIGTVKSRLHNALTRLFAEHAKIKRGEGRGTGRDA